MCIRKDTSSSKLANHLSQLVRRGGECTETHRKGLLIPWNSVESVRNKFIGVIPDNRIKLNVSLFKYYIGKILERVKSIVLVSIMVR
ncbi:hypothetical protein GCM10028791_21840 [Echinicola sediminis]